MDYSRLAQDHVAWTRGVLIGRVDENNKIISFEYPSDFDKFFLLTQAASEELYLESILDEIPFGDLQDDFLAWINRSTRRLQGFDVPWKIEQDSKPQQIAFDWLSKTLWPELPTETDLQGYTLYEFRRFFAALFVYGYILPGLKIIWITFLALKMMLDQWLLFFLKTK